MAVTTTAGRHLLAEYHGCAPGRLDDQAHIEGLMRRAAEVAGATVVACVFHRFAPQGVTGVVIIEESHLSVHTWPEHGYAAVDFFTCGDCDPEAAHDFLRRQLGAARSEIMLIERGLPPEDGAMAVRRHDVDYGIG